MKRDLAAFEAERFDVLVLGGGILGASVAWEAARRGLRVALLEKDDFASGASANTMRIMHGGLRYLQHLDIPRMRRSIRERSAWLRMAPHLVEPASFLLPSYRQGMQRKTLMGLAVALNELISWDRNRGLPEDRRLPAGRIVSRRTALSRVPELAEADVTGGIIFYDGLVYSPERLVVEIVAAAMQEGAVAANHVAPRGPLRTRGRLDGVLARDRLNGEELEVRARTVVNATGAAVETVASKLMGRASDPSRRHLLALNLVVPSTGHDLGFAVRTPAAESGTGVDGAGRRQLFVVPWRERTLIGTAYYGGRAAHEGMNDPEPYVARFLEEVNAAVPGSDLRRSDVIGVHRGLLPVRSDDDRNAAQLLEEHRIRVEGSEGECRVVSVEVEKYTTARHVAEETVRQVLELLGRLEAPVSGPPVLPGGFAGSCDAFTRRAGREHPELEPTVAEHLVRSYGRRYSEVLACGDSWPGWDRRVVAEAPVIEAQLHYAVEREMARTVSDMLDRRTDIGPRGLLTERATARAEAILTHCDERELPSA